MEPPNARFELKFIAERMDLAELIALVRRQPGLFREVYPNRVVNNIYLDTPGLDDFEDWRIGVFVYCYYYFGGLHAY